MTARCLIQARTGSTRLPGKVLRPLGERSVLGWVVRAAEASGVFEGITVATTLESDDLAIVDECADLGIAVTRGPTDDVLARFLSSLDEHPGDPVVRLTADCPLLDPRIIATAVRAFDDSLDYLSTTLIRTLPRGLDVEVTTTDALRRAGAGATGHERVHVTPHLYRNPDRFRCAGLVFAPPAADLRVTLDTEQDWQLVSAIAQELGDRPPDWRDVVELLRRRPDLVELNADVRQKDPEDG